jgi:hypothetical protein
MIYSNKRIILLVLTIFVMAVSSDAAAQKAMKVEKERAVKTEKEPKKEKSVKRA